MGRCRTRVRRSALLAALMAGVASVAPLSDAGAATRSSPVHRNTIACEYVYQSYSGLFQRPRKDFEPSTFPQKVGGAASTMLRRELTYWKAAKAHGNWAAVNVSGIAMVNTCDHLGLSRLD